MILNRHDSFNKTIILNLDIIVLFLNVFVLPY